MSQPFEDLPTTPRADEVIDKAFSRGARAGGSKDGLEAQQSMLQTAGNIASDNLQNVATSWPDVDELHPFYRDLADAVLGDVLPTEGDEPAGVDALRTHLGNVDWAASTVADLRDEYQGRLRRADLETGRKLRKQAYARIDDVVGDVEDDLVAVASAREALRDLPDIRPDEPTIVVAGAPNVGKSSFVNAVTNADNDTATYPFTTTQVHVGHLERDHIRYQLVDTPGLLDRPADERSPIEAQGVSALTHLADAVLVFLDPSGECGYPLDTQLALRDDVLDRFDVPVRTVANKSDRSRNVDADVYVSITEDENVDALVDMAVEAVGYEPELPYDG